MWILLLIHLPCIFAYCTCRLLSLSGFLSFCFPMTYGMSLLFSYQPLQCLCYVSVWRLKSKSTGRFISRNRLQQQHTKVNEDTSIDIASHIFLWVPAGLYTITTSSTSFCFSLLSEFNQSINTHICIAQNKQSKMSSYSIVSQVHKGNCCNSCKTPLCGNNTPYWTLTTNL